MDPADANQLKAVLDMHRAMRGNHQTQLNNISRVMEAMVASITGIAAETQQLQLTFEVAKSLHLLHHLLSLPENLV